MEIYTPVVHNLGPAADHDMACAVCRSNHAVLNMNEGVFEPCWGCQSEGWTLAIRKSWWRRLNPFAD